ncbi:Protein required for ethanol metabolism [Podochytrium sp. JEL0797]|nr:Protein required for ethanol metabolism [Podochytrium sp. JEL0797]
MFKAYDRILRRYPVTTQAVTTAGLFILGDVLAQQVVEERMSIAKHDFSRTLRMAAFGGLIAGPSIAMWYPFLQRTVSFKSETASVVARVALDQTLFAPTFIGVFITSTTLMSGQTVGDVKTRLNEGYKEALINNWKIWPAVQLMNFAFVPLLYRSLVVNVFATGWNTYLSLLSSRLNAKSE